MTHTMEEDFEHFLSYSGLWKETPETIGKLKQAFDAAWEPKNTELLEALKKMVLVFDVGMGNSAEEKEALEEARAAIERAKP